MGLIFPNNNNMYKQKLPRRILPLDMPQSGVITVVYHPSVKMQTTYTISTDDGRACINGWDNFVHEVRKVLVIGQKVLMLLFTGDHGLYLFVCHIPMIKDE